MGQLWWFPRIDLIDLTWGRAIRAMKEDWAGARVRPLPAQLWKGTTQRLECRLGGYEYVQARAQGGIFCDGHVGNR